MSTYQHRAESTRTPLRLSTPRFLANYLRDPAIDPQEARRRNVIVANVPVSAIVLASLTGLYAANPDTPKPAYSMHMLYKPNTLSVDGGAEIRSNPDGAILGELTDGMSIDPSLLKEIDIPVARGADSEWIGLPATMVEAETGIDTSTDQDDMVWFQSENTLTGYDAFSRR